ncbi:predicted protein [Scheffersomyces stipitis CBS 6054]|uniref:Uncharacterized protein n=1 Tax=Scheffersomyces stipitis (strain ATCC 58785 / CBS 6054 / NBRC 10063 / NRRL Y-11545) TaxID=322104 RepID=A3LPP6_PICST|nr:predicted protein [Scheffersomyces stipitis CBS 6054]ABN64534.2 predicted protein [Scheffersomyces stipitis CBS 6054]KAG2736999.1 hypothetical protein G9P44_001089 [Scheffersomyces stipitis]
MSVLTNPSSYSPREVLLLVQLLHTHTILDPQGITSASDETIQKVLNEWKNHASVKMEQRVIKVNTRLQLKELYENLLKKYEVDSTVDLANIIFYSRLEELENKIQDYKKEFQETLEEQ